jgi:hypothetical protein
VTHPTGPSVWLCSLAISLCIIGCSEPEPILSYTVDKVEVKTAQQPRIESQSPQETAQPHKPAQQGSLVYDTPAGWKQAAKVMFADASLAVTDGDETAKITVSPMGAAQAALIPNVTRWRRQLGLGPISAKEIESSVEKIKVGDATAQFLKIVGPDKNGRSETFLIALLPQGQRVLIVKLRAESKLAAKQKEKFLQFVRSLKYKIASQPPQKTAQPQKLAQQGSLVYDTPTGWKQAAKVMFADASLAVADGDETAKITVSPMGATQAALVPNVTRWRRQLGLGPISAKEIESSVEKIKVGDATAQYLKIVGPEKNGRSETFLIALLPHNQRVLIVKLKAESKLAAKQKEKFLQFVRSLKYKKV